MANPSIGTEEFVTLDGPIDLLGAQVEEITRPGEDGHAFVRIGDRSMPSRLISFRDEESAADVQTRIAWYKEFEGDLADIVDGLGNIYSNVLIRKVEVLEARAVGTVSGGLTAAPTHILRCAWEVQATENP